MKINSACPLVCLLLLFSRNGLLGEQPPDAEQEVNAHGNTIPSLNLPYRRIGSTNLLHGSFCSTLAFSPDGSLIATASADNNSVRLWCCQTGALRGAFDVGGRDGVLHWPGVSSIAFSHDGRFLAVAGNDGSVTLFDVPSRRKSAELLRAPDPLTQDWTVKCVRISPDSQMVAAVVELFGDPSLTPGTGRIRLWDIRSGRRLRQEEKGERFSGLAFSPKGKHIAATIASTDGPGAIVSWHIKTGAARWRSNIENLEREIRYSPSGTILAVASSVSDAHWRGELVHIIDDATGRQLRQLEVATEVCRATFAFSPDGRSLATVCATPVCRLQVWNLATGRLAREVPLSNGFDGMTVEWSPDGKLIAVAGGPGGRIQVWESGLGRPALTPGGHDREIAAMTLSNSEELLTTLDESGIRCEWEVKTGREVDRELLVKGGVGARRVAMQSRVTAYLPDDQNVLREWSRERSTDRVRVASVGKDCECIALSTDGHSIATGHRDGSVVLWNAESGKKTREFRWAGNRIVALALSPDGTTVACGNGDGAVGIVGLSDSDEIRTCFGPEPPDSLAVDCLVFSRDGKTLMSGSRDATARLFDVEKRTELKHFELPILFEDEGDEAQSVLQESAKDDAPPAPTEDVDRDVQNSAKEGVERDAATPKGSIIGFSDPCFANAYASVGDAVTAAAFSPNGSQVALGSALGRVYLWEISSDHRWALRGRHEDKVQRLVFSADGRRLYSSGVTVIEWDLTSVAAGRR